MQRAGGRWLIVVAAACAGPAPATAAPNDAVELARYDVAPIDCWPMPDGCAARTGATATLVPRGPLERAWTYEPKRGPITGEPLVWKDLVVVPFDDGFEALDLATGQMLVAKRNITKETTAAPVVGPGFVLVRTTPDRLEAFSIDGAAHLARSIWSWKNWWISKPIVRDREVYVFGGSGAFRLRVGAGDEVWRSPEPVRPEPPPGERNDPPSFNGEASILGDGLFIVTEHSIIDTTRTHETLIELLRIDVATGSRGPAMYISTAPSEHPFDSRYEIPTRITGRSGGEIFVQRNWGIGAKGGATTTTALFAKWNSSDRDVRLLSLTRAPVRWKDRWVLVERADDRTQTMGLTIDPASRAARVGADGSGASVKYDVLSDASRLPDVVNSGVPATAAGDAILVGSTVFDARTREVLHSLPAKAVFRTIPVRDTILLVEGEQLGHGARLVAFRPIRGGSAVATIAWKPPTAAGTTTGDSILTSGLTVVRRDGVVKSGVVAFAPGADSISFPRPGAASPAAVASTAPPAERWLLADVALIADSGRHVLHAGDVDEAVAAMRRIDGPAIAKDWLTLAADACSKGAATEARAAVKLAEAYGARDGDILRLLAEIDGVEKRARAVAASDWPKLIAKVSALQTKSAGTIWSWSKGIPEGAAPSLVARLARLALDADSFADDPKAWVRAHVPAGIDTEPSFAESEWLDFLTTMRAHPVRLVADSPEGTAPTNSQRQLASARAGWRKDVEAFESAHVVVITPAVRPARIARTLVAAERVCRTLASIFETRRKKRVETDPLVIYLYESKKEYVEHSAGLAGIEFPLWHYAPGDRVLRLYMPEDEAEFTPVSSTFAHELTHQWMQLCCSAFSDAAPTVGRRTVPAYWIVEGFANLMEEGRFDPVADRYVVETPTAASIDVVANVESGELIPWRDFFAMEHGPLYRLSTEKPRTEVPVRWRGGAPRVVAGYEVYFAQAAAASRHLYFAHQGKYRKVFLDFVVEFHAGRAEPDTLAKLLNIRYEALGGNVRDWCREQQVAAAK